MKVQFIGTPSQVLGEMREFIARLSLEFGEADTAPKEVPAPMPTVPAPVWPDDFKKPIRVDVDDDFKLPFDDSDVVAGNEHPQKSESHGCQFCGKFFTGTGHKLRHEKFCKQNPNRISHPWAGKKPTWLTKKDKSNAQPQSGSDNLNDSNEGNDDDSYF